MERKRKHSRAPCERILIVSEGSKTEPQYFDEIRNYTKGMSNVFATTHCHLEAAIQRAETIAAQFNTRAGPFTHVAKLVQLLTELRP